MLENESNRIVHKYIRTSRRMFHKAHKELERIGLYRGQPPLLYALWKKDGQSGRELSEALGIQPATVTKMVQRLKNAGFIMTKQDVKDSRVSRVYLTEEGQGVKESVNQVYSDLTAQIFAGFSQEELSVMESFLDRMMDNVKCSSGCERGKCHEEDA